MGDQGQGVILIWEIFSHFLLGLLGSEQLAYKSNKLSSKIKAMSTFRYHWFAVLRWYENVGRGWVGWNELEVCTILAYPHISSVHTNTHTRILIPFGDSKPMGLKGGYCQNKHNIKQLTCTKQIQCTEPNFQTASSKNLTTDLSKE